MPLFIVLVAVIQAWFVLHVFRTGRSYWWAVVITATPLVGCAVYYFMEMFPKAPEFRTARRVSSTVASALVPQADLRRLLIEVQNCPSVSNKVATAQALMRAGMYYRAVGFYEDALRGIYATDPQLLIGLALAHVGNQTFEQAREVLERLTRIDARFRPEEVRLLNARALEGLGRYEEALHEYAELCSVYVGLEAKCRYGLLLKQMGFITQANEVFSDVLVYARRFDLRLPTEKAWVETARASIVEAT
jgi:hypothetical protein